ncbi:MAG: arsenate reductase ArsC [Bdellovibrionales bacterium]|nr:arsenate reductase ArsC [Bdellovibrionales bacterium]
MAEGWARHLHPTRIEAYSAGVSPHGLNPLAAKVMAEVGVPLTDHHSKHVDELKAVPFDFVVGVCDSATEACPVLAGPATMIRHSFEDPPKLAQQAADESEALPHYRRVRDEIKAFIASLPELLEERRRVP